MRWVCVVGCVVGCKAKPAPPPARDAAVAVVHDASVDAPSTAWSALDDYERVDAVRTIAIPTNSDLPRFDVGGPVIAGDLAIVASSQFGFAAVDYRRGGIAWTKPAGLHVAPPLVHGTSIVLVGECAHPPQTDANEELLGCLRVVATTGSDEAYIAVRGSPRVVAEFVAEKGPQQLWDAGERAVRWRRGDRAVTIDLISGIATPAPAEPPPLAITYRGTRWDITQRDGRIVATGKKPWQTEHAYTAVLGAVWLPEQSPFVRIVDRRVFAGEPEISVFDMDATGSLHAAFAKPVPGIDVVGHGVSVHGDAALAVRLDRSRTHDFIAGYAANALLAWVHVLPERERVDPIGVAVAEDAVVVFHDGDTVSVLPELSAPPTAPGSTKGSSNFPTP